MIFDFTICIITFNRGKRVLSLVNTLLENLEKNWCVLILDNASTNGVEYYQEIHNISKVNKQVDYIKHDVNGQFHGNYLSCFKHTKTKHFMILSDEDFINHSGVKSVLEDIKLKENLGMCRASIGTHESLKVDLNSFVFANSFYKAGEEAMKGICFSGNYISGIIYNLDLIKKYDLIPILEKNIEKHAAYPHIYFDLLISAKCDVMRSSEIVVLEGVPEKTLDERGIEYTTFEHVGMYGFGARINQFFSLRDGIFDAVNLLKKENTTDEFIIFLGIYLLLVQKYFYLIADCNMNSYKKNFLEESLLKESFYYITTSAVFAYPQIGPFKETVLSALTDIYQNHK